MNKEQKLRFIQTDSHMGTAQKAAVFQHPGQQLGGATRVNRGHPLAPEVPSYPSGPAIPSYKSWKNALHSPDVKVTGSRT